jgi:hypothetical protein
VRKKKLKKWKWYKIPGKKALICYIGDISFGFNFVGEWTDYFNMDYGVTCYQNWIKADEKEVIQRLLEMAKKANKMDKVLNFLSYE